METGRKGDTTGDEVIMITTKILKDELKRMFRGGKYEVEENEDGTYRIVETMRDGTIVIYPKAVLTSVKQGRYTIYDLDTNHWICRFGVKDSEDEN